MVSLMTMFKHINDWRTDEYDEWLALMTCRVTFYSSFKMRAEVCNIDAFILTQVTFHFICMVNTFPICWLFHMLHTCPYILVQWSLMHHFHQFVLFQTDLNHRVSGWVVVLFRIFARTYIKYNISLSWNSIAHMPIIITCFTITILCFV